MIILPFDLETTGKLTPDHKIIEFYGARYQDGVKLDELHLRFDPQRSIAIDAFRVHGISLTDLAGKPLFSAHAVQIRDYMLSADTWAGHNIEDFDVPFLDQELAACGLILPKKHMLDSMKEGSWATPDGKVPNLAELCFAAGVPYDKALAHKADYDVGVNYEAIRFAIDWGFMKLPAA